MYRNGGNGLPIAGTPLDTTNNSRLYYNVITALGFERSGNGITLDEYEDNHFFLVFDLTATREASKSLTLFPELTGAGLTLKLTFAAALPEAVEIVLFGERYSQFTIDASRNILKNSGYWPMDNETLIQLTQGCCPLLFNKNLGVASADNFLVEKGLEKSFQQSGAINFLYQIVNTSKSDQIGQHWLLVCLVPVGRDFGHRKTRKDRREDFVWKHGWNTFSIFGFGTHWE